ncbi:DUF3696 domain-containing protein [Azospirillum sp. RWY-5-1]|uniref:DUF3696 domain-containing protein n=1 Tax=Azospirillum oleiclasticum TaxID=2735135 RepID=A0ABX2TDF4_9PROT|nr:DUF3696 domain-containing protein [Azospirillum oleiclasticum]NYZ16883.1 DUF3696 domain-containing protein [Azospirillum oleiclasticum]NYZ21820.1 DUF3696 domain-containing protein [Azospirillum oleiclasticum]
MLTRLRLRNFKAFRELDLELGPVTVLFGPNSAGKSTIQQFLLLLKQTVESSDRNIALALDGAYANLGTMRDLLHGHDETRPFEWTLDFRYWEDLELVDPESADQKPFATGDRLSVSSRVDSENTAPKARELGYTLGGASFRLCPRDGASGFELTAENVKPFQFKRTRGRKGDLAGPEKSYAYPDQIKGYYQNAGFLSDLVWAFEEQFRYLYYLGPLRMHPRRDYPWSRTRPSDVGQMGERAIEAILAATLEDDRRQIRPRGRYQPFQSVIAHWLKDMGLVDSFTVEEIAPGANYWGVKLTTSAGAAEVALTDVGFGLSQVLPVIVLLYYVDKGSTVLIEQPELHLHPRAQGVLADLILYVTKHRGIQVIVETHSEHLLLRLQRRIAEAAASAEDAKLYFISAQRGASYAEPLRLNELGEIENWPDNFFGDAFGETAAAELARLDRISRS